MATTEEKAIGEVLWTPTEAAVKKSNIFKFIKQINNKYKVDKNYRSLYQWSVDQPEAFWSNLWRYADVIHSEPWHSVLEQPGEMPGAKWFSGSRLNFAENLLRYDDAHPAIIFQSESGAKSEYSYATLNREVLRHANLLRSLGVKRGDRVAGYMANIPESVFAMLAATSLGAIWSSCSPDFGTRAVVERFSQIEPKVLYAIDGYQYNGKMHASLDTVRTVAESIPSIEQVIVVPFVAEAPDISAIRDAVVLDTSEQPEGELQFAQLPFDHPLYILYSSGTTGAPKCIVHGAGGTLLQHIKEHRLHCDISRADRLFFFTTCGWMMWNWLVSGLASGCTLVLYEGSPFFPRRRSLWQIAEETGITIFGTSARYLAACSKARLKPMEDYDLSALRAILSTGSPLAPESFDYVYNNIKRDLMLSSISGGTDIVSCFVLGNPTLPVHRGEIQSRGLGLAVDVYEGGQPVRGKRGELVCTKPFPCMPIGFWGEDDDSRYLDAYFSRFPGVWAQGDYAEITEHDGVVIYGRSDAVLNPGGVRIGTAEIYRQVEKIEEVLESICIGQIWADDVRIVLFVMLREGVLLDDDLKAQIREVIRENTTPRHIPRKIIAVPDIPRTLSGKIVELAVRNVVHGDPVENTDALANPEALEHFRNLDELSFN